MTINPIIALIIGVVGGFAIALIIYFIKRNTAFKLISQSTKIAEELEKNAKIEAENAKKAALLEAREEWIKQKRLLDEEIKERQKELRLEEKKYNELLSSLDKRLDSLDKKENALHEEYIENLYRKDAFYTFQSGENIFSGKIVDVTKTGSLIIETDLGEQKSFLFKEVEFCI